MTPDGWWWVSTERFTVSCRVAGGVIVGAAPLIRRFIGQPLGNLTRWAGKFGGLRVERLKVA